MDTRWKKCKALFSFAAFAVGATLFLANLTQAVCAYLPLAGQDLTKPGDYQETEQFRYIIEERLNSLLGVATGGSGWYTGLNSGVYIQNGYDGGLVGWLDRGLNAGPVTEDVTAEASKAAEVTTTVVQESADTANVEQGAYFVESPYYDIDDYEDHLRELYGREQEELISSYASEAAMEEYLMELADLYGDDFANAVGNGYYGSNQGIYFDEEGNIDKEKTLEAYLYNMGQDQNLLYAIVSQGELRYTNIEGLTEQTKTAWDGADFAQALPEGEYNFQLWYNREGDGKVQIAKDGRQADVYGDGVYRTGNDWRVPGYANFKLGDPAKEAVIFLAAAKTPELYLVGNYEGNGITQYGGNLYYLNESVKLWDWRFKRACLLLIVGTVLLLLSLIMWKSLGTAVKVLTKILGKIPLILKIVVFLILAAFTIPSGCDAFGSFYWCMERRLLLDSDDSVLLNYMMMAANCLAVWFWLAFAAVLDGRANVRRQRQEMLERRQMRELKYPVQKRLVRRERNRLFADGGVILVAAAVVLAAYLMWREYIEKYYDYWEWYNDGRIFGFRGLAGLIVMTAFAVFGVLLLFVGSDMWRFRKSRRLAEDIGTLSDRIGEVREGKLTGDLRLPEDSDLREAAENLNEIRIGLETALAEQIKSERMKVELVTNVSHDIKTPLTSIISYVELLRQEEELPRHVKEYIQILGEKSERLRSIVQDVFEVSKAASGQLPMQMELLDMSKLLRQTLADMNGQIGESSLIMRATIPQTPVFVQADGQRLYRVFQNLIQNALHYSLEGSRIYLTLETREEKAVVQIKNTSSVELADNKDFTERFVRGDDSRTDGGSGLGLSIAKSFTEACGGSFLVETNADLFTVTVSFMISGQEPMADNTEPDIRNPV